MRRAVYIDLAKGVCILLVVFTHCDWQILYPLGITALRMPLYFCLSGLFFKDYGGMTNLLVKKINRLIIPCFFFYILTIIPLILWLYTHGIAYSHQQFHLDDILKSKILYNGPLWFLLALFWDNVIFYILNKTCKRNYYILGILCISIGLLGILRIEKYFPQPLYIHQAMLGLPFFYLGYVLKRTDLLSPVKNRFRDFFVGFLLVIVGVRLSQFGSYPSIQYSILQFEGNMMLFPIVSVSMIIGLLLLCRSIQFIPIISYIGRFSIIILVTHYVIIDIYNRTINANYEIFGNPYVKFLIAISVSFALIFPMRKYLPEFTSQKDLFKITPHSTSTK